MGFRATDDDGGNSYRKYYRKFAGEYDVWFGSRLIVMEHVVG